MNIQDIQKLYGVLPQGDALMKTMEEKSVRTVFLQGLLASATPMFFASIVKRWQKTMLFVLNDNDEAGYFYNDLKTIAMPENGQEQTAEVLFFPSSYRRAVKYGQRDAGNEILRTEVLSRLSVINEAKATASLPLCIVTEPSALAELVVAKHKLDEHTLSVSVGQTMDLTETEKILRSYGFQQVDYVYELGQFAVRGSILDVYSFSSELPYRIDFFGNDVDTIRTFEVETQLSKDKKEKVEIVPELATLSEEKIPFLQFLPKDSVLVMKDLLYIHDTIERIYNDGFTAQALTEQLEGKTETEQNELRKQLQANLQLITAQQFTDDALNFKRIEFGANRAKNEESKAIIRFNISPQPLFHKNFELLTQSLKDYLLQGYKLYILADSEKQTMRLRDIFDSKGADSKTETTSVADNIPFMPVNRTIHEGFIDNDLKVCFFTDHQIFDRFHKYSLKSDKARQGKMALTMKELQEMEPGDFLVHVDFGIGKFAGLVRVPAGESYQEMIRLVYQHNDIVDVSIHSLYKISKYRRADSGDAAPRLSVLGSGAWDRLKEKAKKRIKDIARDLIKLYAKRRHEKGFSFSPDSFMQHELEASFLYEDTPDQLKATQDLKHDMESSRPMDRLVCGDVGFGKTEVA
ncbi:CarD family transcriptional regulator, partial [Prevotella pallens]